MKQTKHAIDNKLTPQNAADRGYRYIDDVFNPYAAIEEIVKLAVKQGFKLGVPGGKDKKRFGLYRIVKVSKV